MPSRNTRAERLLLCNAHSVKAFVESATRGRVKPTKGTDARKNS